MTGPRRGLSEQATDAAIDQACRMLRLHTIRDRAGEVAAAAQGNRSAMRGSWPNSCWPSATTGTADAPARRLKAAGFPREKWLTDFDYAANPNIAPAVIATWPPAPGSPR